ncbi:lipid-A-disaccharide synthase N-terminal domain-containing protein [Ancylobacter pratisalsi]|uniref:Lipid A biosynthesis protein n=1 Tax=Ancylobacter pratisalsi TaxID=1745854 RepID=A0A6P1YRC6_9HYPH|nr:lipid-A-disaccharide synthase N-terminal domain-containing protein [Ancylobacter pratisalsi]QIB36057.1 lipid A biosynthesis protein [Ancylobacter pratisalsi]
MTFSLTPWLMIGFVGQALFTMRFLVQWIASERARRSVVPVAFWGFSMGGGMTLLAYAIYRQDPVFMVGQAAGLLIYSRNIYFVLRERSGRAGAPAEAEPGS